MSGWESLFRLTAGGPEDACAAAGEDHGPPERVDGGFGLMFEDGFCWVERVDVAGGDEADWVFAGEVFCDLAVGGFTGDRGVVGVEERDPAPAGAGKGGAVD